MTLSSGQSIEWPIRGGEGDEMAVTVQTQFESVVTEMYEEAFVGSSIENGTTLITFDLRKLDVNPGSPRRFIGERRAITSMCMNSPRFIIRSSIDLS